MNLLELDIKNRIQSEKDWTLFLDRDGVINRRIIGDYVKRIEDFQFLPGVLNAMSVFAKHFKTIIIVTNQQGIGKGLMTEGELNQIHNYMISEITKAGGRVDSIYHSPFLASSNSSMRKPEIGMAVKAKADFQHIDFAKSIMVGDSLSDMQFGKNAGMTTVYTIPEQAKEQVLKFTDMVVDGLQGFKILLSESYL